MTALIKPLLLAALLLLGMVAPDLAFAQVAKPPGGTHWDLYVYGNGQVVFSILMGIKMLMVPDAGQTGFMTLLLVMATMGFVVLAVAAGFDPAKNLLRMFGYILVVWMVTFGSTKLTANVVIIDLARDQNGSASEPYAVDGAPALVVLPAALTSEVGQYFTRVIETYFTVAGGDEFKMSGAGVGQFNLFGKMMAESTQYVLTNGELKRSLSGYTANCVVPAMALGKLNGPVKAADGKETTASGTQALLRTINMAKTLSSASNPAILTTYYPFSRDDTAWIAKAEAEAGTLSQSPEALDQYASSGVLVSCKTAWDLIEKDMDTHANLLMQAGADGWAKTGIMVPFETAFNTMLGQAAAPGAVAGANFSRPQGFIMQQAMVNSMNGSFRQAAIQTGNNELMQATALSQAEQQQKSAWTAAFSVFNNMMGYVFTVLQAFIFALTPLIVIALMVPGLGKSIFTNYAQVLIWLTLWQPMLALINFILILFATESVSTTISMEGGISLANKALLSEKTNDLMIAAGFLGTMTPLLSWGIVKGAMAFTEFISKGVGSEFASQAGASAATGNISMGNLSTGNVGMDKYSTQMSSAVGAQGVSAGMGAQSLTTSQDAGGGSAKMNDEKISSSAQSVTQQQAALQQSKAISDALSHMKNENFSQSQVESWARGEGSTLAQQQAAQLALGKQDSWSRSHGAASTQNEGTNVQTSASAEQGGSVSNTLSAGVNGGISGNLGVVSGGVSGGFSQNDTSSNSNSVGAGVTNVGGVNNSSELSGLKSSAGGSIGQSYSSGTSSSQSQSSDHSVKSDSSLSIGEALSQAKSFNDSITQSISSSTAVSDNFGYSNGMSLSQAQAGIAALESERASLMAQGAEMAARSSSMTASLGGSVAGFQGTYNSTQQGIEAARTSMGGVGVAGDGGLGSWAADSNAQHARETKAAQQQVSASHSRVEGNAASRMADNGAAAPKHVTRAVDGMKAKQEQLSSLPVVP